MVSLFNYFDYREYLKDYYEFRKTRDGYFSYRFMAAKVGLHSSHLIRIFQKLRHITEHNIPAFVTLCGLKEKEASYFEALVAYNKARSDNQARTCFERLLALTSVEVRTVTEQQYELFRHWYYGAIRALLSFSPFSGDYQDLARRLSPPITVPQAKQAIRLLENLGLIHRKDDGFFALTDQFVTTGVGWKNIAVRAFQQETMGLALESLDRHPKDDRDISTVTIAVAKKDLPAIKDRIAEFRRSLLGMVKESAGYDEVYQLNVQLFPLSNNGGKAS